jgi:two-component system LytT family sensor kinase
MRKHKLWVNWWFPLLYGLMNYALIRLITDVMTGIKFWHRSFSLNATEIGYTILISYPWVMLLEYMLRRAKQGVAQPGTKAFWKEFVIAYFFSALFANATILPLAALTDDGLQWFDVVNINVVTSFFSMTYYAISRVIMSLRINYEQQLQIEKISNDQLQTELRFLKAQYHPHFLFNALNTAYFQMEDDTAQARETLEKLSELLRYQLYDPQHEVPIRRELDYLQSFIDLQKQRMNPHLRLEVNFDKDLQGQVVYPLLLLPLVENAFKYAGGEYWINISAQKDNDTLRFHVSNAVPESMPLPNTKASGIGLENLRRRLALLYPGEHQLQSQKENNQYNSTLIIPL